MACIFWALCSDNGIELGADGRETNCVKAAAMSNMYNLGDNVFIVFAFIHLEIHSFANYPTAHIPLQTKNMSFQERPADP